MCKVNLLLYFPLIYPTVSYKKNSWTSSFPRAFLCTIITGKTGKKYAGAREEHLPALGQGGWGAHKNLSKMISEMGTSRSGCVHSSSAKKKPLLVFSQGASSHRALSKITNDFTEAEI